MSARKAATVPEAVAIIQAGVVTVLGDRDIRHRAWLRFTDDQTFPDECEPIAELAFEAGYIVAMGHIGELLEGFG